MTEQILLYHLSTYRTKLGEGMESIRIQTQKMSTQDT